MFFMGMVLIAFGFLVGVLGNVPSAQAQVSGISYTLSPTGNYILFGDNAGLKDGIMYGGELGFGFGRYLELDGVYLTGSGFKTDFAGFSNAVFASSVTNTAAAKLALEGLATRKMDLTHYGGKLRFNLGKGRLIPFVTAGTGVQQFKTDDISSSEQIYTNLGAGLTFSVANRYTLSVGGERLSYRYNPGSILLSEDDLSAVGLTRESFNTVGVNNIVLSTSLKIFLGGRSENTFSSTDQAMINQFKGGNFRLAVEPFYGQINFNSALGFPDSRAVAGVNAGFDLGPYVGLRGFYWFDTEQPSAFDGGVPDAIGDLRMYGGELDLRFGGSAITPYLIVGGGYMDIEKADDFIDINGDQPENRYFAMGGAGVEVPIFSAISLQAGVRGLLMSTEDLEDVNGPSNVFGSLMYTGGINFNIGGKSRVKQPSNEPMLPIEPAKEIPVEEKEVVTEKELPKKPKTAEERVKELEAELEKVQAKVDSLQTKSGVVVVEGHPMNHEGMEGHHVEVDSVVVKKGKSNISDRVLTIPVPEVGEIYIRFGESTSKIKVDSTLSATIDESFEKVTPETEVLVETPAGKVVADSTVLGARITPEEIQEIVRGVLAEQSAKEATKPGVTAEQLEESLKKMEDRLNKRISNEMEKINEKAIETKPAIETPAHVEVVVDSTAQDSNGLFDVFADRELHSVLPQVGVRLKDGIDRVILGARADYRFPDQSVRFMPEAAITIGEAVGLSALANVAWYPYDFSERVHFYGGAGAGLVSDKFLSGLELKLNLFAGLEYQAKTGTSFFGELSTLDFFDYNRIVFGYRVVLDK